MDAEQKGHTLAADAPGAKQGKTKAVRGTAENHAAEREHYVRRIAANEERLRTGLTADG